MPRYCQVYDVLTWQCEALENRETTVGQITVRLGRTPHVFSTHELVVDPPEPSLCSGSYECRCVAFRVGCPRRRDFFFFFICFVL